MIKPNMKTPAIFRIGLALLCLMLFSFALMGNLYARYTVSDASSDGATVATFSFSDDLSEQSLTMDLSLAPGESEETPIKVVNNGEVALKCVVKLDNLTNNLPVEDKEVTVDIPMGEEKTVTLELEWPSMKNDVSFMGKTDIIRISVRVEQID